MLKEHILYLRMTRVKMGTSKEKIRVFSSGVVCSVTLLLYDFTERVGFQSQRHRLCSSAAGIAS